MKKLSEFSVRWVELKKSSDTVNNYSKQLYGYSEKIEKIKNNLSLSSAVSSKLKSSLSSVSEKLKLDANKIEKMSNALQYSASKYEETERKLSSQGTSFNWNKKHKATNIVNENAVFFSKKDNPLNPRFVNLLKSYPDYAFTLLKEFGVPGAAAGLIQNVYGLLTGAGDKTENMIKAEKSSIGLVGDIMGSFSGDKFSWSKFFGVSKDNSLEKFINGFKVGNGKSVIENVGAVAKWGGYAATTALYAYENFYGEDSDKTSLQRKIEKTVTESALDIGIGIGIGAICASVGAPAIVGGLVFTAAKWGADYLCNKYLHKSAFSAASDAILDAKDSIVNNVKEAGKALNKAVGDGAKAIGEKLSGWWNSGGKIFSGA